MTGAITVRTAAASRPAHAAKRTEPSISSRMFRCGSPTQREIDGNRLKKYNHTNVWSAINARWEAPNQPSDRSANMKPNRTVQKYHMNAQASSVKPIGEASLICAIKHSRFSLRPDQEKPILFRVTYKQNAATPDRKSVV